MPLLSLILTGDRSNTSIVASLARPAKIYGYERLAVANCDYPAALLSQPSSCVEGMLLQLTTKSQKTKLDNFEGDIYKRVSVPVHLNTSETPAASEAPVNVEADVYVWDGDREKLTSEPWSLQIFEAERLEDWLDLFDGMEFLSDEEE